MAAVSGAVGAVMSPRAKAKQRSGNVFAAIEGAREAKDPGFIEPMHPTQRPTAPAGELWLHEIKVDGYRCQLRISRGAVRMYTRRGYDWSARFRTIAEAAKQLPVREAIIDGEVIVAAPNGLSDFTALQSELAAGSSDRLTYYAFDLLYADGYDLRRAKLVDRKAALARLFAKAPAGRFLFAEHVELDGPTVLRRACEMGIEGVVSKQRDAPYSSGRSERWIKALCRKRDTFTVVGFIPAGDARIAALYLGREEGRGLVYAGKAGTGFTAEAAQMLRERLQPLVTRKTPLTSPVAKPKATWVRPSLLVDIEYRAVTPDGLLRHASFKGVRDDKIRAQHPSDKARKNV